MNGLADIATQPPIVPPCASQGPCRANQKTGDAQ